MKNIILLFAFIFLATNCVSKQEARQPSGLFDFLSGGSDKGLTIMKCKNCKSPHAQEGTVQLEYEKKCTSDRLYYQDEFKKISDAFKNKREVFTEAKFPAACIVYAMRSWDVYDKSTRSLAECSQEASQPVRQKKLACVTPEYAYSTYNAYVDVMDCLDIPQKELLPKIWNESFFHVNAYGAGDDAGVGQLTGDAIQEVIKQKYADSEILEIEFFKQEMQKAHKPSCDRILAEPSAWEVVSAQNSLRCGLMMPASSPLRNILYTGIFYRVITERLTGITYRAGKEMIRTPEGLVERVENSNATLGGLIQKLEFKEKMEALGIENPNMNYLKQVLVTLAFNAGARTSATILDNFFKARIANNMTLDDRDLDFLSSENMKLSPLVDSPKDETESEKANRLSKLEQAREIAHENGMPLFIRLMQTVGAPGYVSKVGYRSAKFDREIGDKVCTQPLFLQHYSPPNPSPATD